MALANNQREQLADRLKADIELREPGFTVARSVATSGEPLLTVNDGTNDIAVLAIQKRTFDGFNVVAELSASAAEGLPEHITWLAIRADATQAVVARLTVAARDIFASSLKLVFETPVNAASVLDEAKVAEELPNSARYGASGQ